MLFDEPLATLAKGVPQDNATLSSLEHDDADISNFPNNLVLDSPHVPWIALGDKEQCEVKHKSNKLIKKASKIY